MSVADMRNKKMSTRGKKESDSSEVDRLSHLPEIVQQHILSFLDTREAVQTSVLSKKWRNLWTAIPALNLTTSSFSRLDAFKNFVSNVLGKRNHDSPVCTCCFFLGGYDGNLLNRAISYAKSHDVNHFSININPSGHHSCKPFPSILLQCQDLETLGLKGFGFTEPFKYTKLTSLRLDNCNFLGKSYIFDVLSRCPSLKNLCLSSCRCDSKLKVLKISGPHLLSLSIDKLKDVKGIECQCEVKISAPEVTFFRCTGLYAVDLLEINFPSLKHADLNLSVIWSCKSLPSRFLECQNLETLLLKGFGLTEPFKYTKLTSLRLVNCNFLGNTCSFDVLSCCPSLKNLCLRGCRCGFKLKVLKISGPHLLSLTIDNLTNLQGKTCQCEVEISAPEVTFFRCTGLYRVDFSEINLPSLKHADLDLSLSWSKPFYGPDDPDDPDLEQKYYNNLVKLLEGISSVQSLTLSSSTIKALDLVPGLEHQPTPFSRLKHWNLKQEEPNNGSFLMPAKVSSFLGCQD